MDRLIGILGILAILGLATLFQMIEIKLIKNLFWGISLQLFFAF